MFAYRFGRLLQVLALIDCAFALFFGGATPEFSGMDAQLQIVLIAGALFAAGRYLQGRGERSMRAAEIIRGDGERGPAATSGPPVRSDTGSGSEVEGER
ncbi:MAG: hypothetical protein QF701_13770 [Nitrospinota bacterium]|jgi:hypothetical protein|nr:hypothetical protein [Nitrospinota bacterium]MDP7168803.1 hypothetical protein [Nitrospinota bacterium]MDP7370957.1 hypothetical protein [Nitrospinota bacterium]MDP7663250.1 hypothetical protein [Nitrospinota bacterium]HJP13676.1 hypothetical protein [Nitrospinota bacterium]